MQENKIIIHLYAPTVLPDLNRKEGKALDYARDTIAIQQPRHQHFRWMRGLADEQQLHAALKNITGLSDRDLDELYTEDAAQISNIIHDFMTEYLQRIEKMKKE